MTGLKPNRTQLHVPGRGTRKIKTIDMVRVAQVAEIEKVQTALDTMHKQVSERITEDRAKSIARHNRITNVTPNFAIGDFVMVRKPYKKGHKNSFRWIGPRQVTTVVGDVVYDVTALHNSKTERVHATRMKMYRQHNASQASESLLEQAKHLETKYELIDKLVKISESEDCLVIQVKWQGLPDEQDWTWQNLSELYEDIPNEVEHFPEKTRNRKLAKKAINALGISSS